MKKLILSILLMSSVGNADVLELNSSNYEKEIALAVKNNRAFIVDAYATWCGPCKVFSPIFEEASNQLTDIRFMKIDVDENRNLIRVRSIPTIILSSKGKVTVREGGFMTSEELIKWIKDNR